MKLLTRDEASDRGQRGDAARAAAQVSALSKCVSSRRSHDALSERNDEAFAALTEYLLVSVGEWATFQRLLWYVRAFSDPKKLSFCDMPRSDSRHCLEMTSDTLGHS